MLQFCLQIRKAAQVASADPTRAGESVDSAFQQLTADQQEQSLQSREINGLTELRMVRPLLRCMGNAALKQPDNRSVSWCIQVESSVIQYAKPFGCARQCCCDVVLLLLIFRTAALMACLCCTAHSLHRLHTTIFQVGFAD
jgi:hypothetical protein